MDSAEFPIKCYSIRGEPGLPPKLYRSPVLVEAGLIFSADINYVPSTVVTPEPSSLFLLALGLVALMGFGLWRRDAAFALAASLLSMRDWFQSA
jgi:hypothetical protein